MSDHQETLNSRAAPERRALALPLSMTLAAGLMAAVLLALAGGVLRAAPATTWYVDAAIGNDGNSCQSPASPCLTVGAAVIKAVSGDAIIVAPGTYIEHLDISKGLVITGAGPELTFLDGGGAGRVLRTSGIAQLTFADLTIRHGRLTGSNDNGAGIFNLGTLRLQNVTIYSNTTNASGGALYNGSGRLTLDNSRVLSNTASGVGGGLYSYYNGAVTVTHSLFAGNDGSQGGGIYSLAALVVQESTLRDNRADLFGGGLTVFGGAAAVARSSFSGNHADSYGGAIVNNLGGLTLTNVTLSHNTAGNYVALANISSSAQTAVLNSTVADNLATTAGIGYGIANINGAILTIQNTLVADNDDRNCLVSGSWTSLGGNLSTDFRCDFHAPGDLEGVNPLLAPLADNGGATRTRALLPGSPAIDAGAAGCPPDDQRGVARPFDGDGDGTAVCDVGAVEARNQLVVSDVTLQEGDAGAAQAVFTVTLAPTSTLPITVAYATADGTAVAGSDYTAVSGVLTFSPGATALPVSVDVLGDTADEVDETFLLNLGPAGGADIVDAQGVATIVDDDGLSSLTIADTAVGEGNSGTTPAAFVVTLSPAAALPVTVMVATVDDTAVAGADYTAVSTSLSFAPGETMQTVVVSVLGDLVDEGASERFAVQLSSPVNASLADGSASGTIQDDDTAQLSLQPGPRVPEGNGGTTPAIFTVTLSTPTAFPVTVEYETSSAIGGSGFAVPGVDYQPISGTLTFAAGETARTVTVLVTGDLDEEEDETFSLMLRNGNPVSILGSTSTGWILNDDGIRVFLPLIVRQAQ